MAVIQPGQGVPHSLVMREAANWLEQLSSEDVTDAEFHAWLRWLDASDAHLHAYWRMEELWQLFDPRLSQPASLPEQSGV